MLVLAALAITVSTGCVFAAASPPCAEAVLDDWASGALDASHSPHCYEAAIDALPEDLRAYTTASDDIGRAAIMANRAATTMGAEADVSARQLSSPPARGDGLNGLPRQVVLLAAFVSILAAGGLTAGVIRRRRVS